jgi:hypothetical protein
MGLKSRGGGGEKDRVKNTGWMGMRGRKVEWQRATPKGVGEEDNTLRTSIDENTISDDNYSV